MILLKLAILRLSIAVATAAGTLTCLGALRNGGDVRVVRLTIEIETISDEVDDLKRKVNVLESSPRISNDAVQEVHVMDNNASHRALLELLSELDRREWEPILEEYNVARLRRSAEPDHR